MKVLICFASLLVFSASQGTETTTPACVQCLHPIWYSAVALYNKGADRCADIPLESVWQCLDICEATPADKPLSYRIRQLTQISDIFYAHIANNCEAQSGSNLGSVGGGCDPLMNCVLSVSNYTYKGRKTHSPFSTVFEYKCGTEARNSLLPCLTNTGNQCASTNRLNKLSSILSLGLEAACDDPRRCVKYGNIFEVKPGTACNEYYQEAAAYGPSIDIAKSTIPTEGFDPAICDIDHLANFACPADPASMPIYSEVPPTTPAPAEAQVVYEPISVNTSLPCEECLYPVWYRAVTTNGSHLCEPSYQSLIYDCLANCQCCPGCQECPERYEQHKTEVFVKLADISKALDMNQCTGNPSCSAESYKCTENLARFYPISAPHVTVNTFSCSATDLAATMSCFQQTCTDVTLANTLINTVIDGVGPICDTDLRCVTYGNIYEYVPVTEAILQNATGPIDPCAHYRQAPINGWSMPTGINRVQDIHLFNTKGCYPDWPENVNCPVEISGADPALINPGLP